MSQGSQIHTLADLAAARDSKQSVFCPTLRSFAKARPAAFIINYSGSIILMMLKSGLFVYNKPSPSKK